MKFHQTLNEAGKGGNFIKLSPPHQSLRDSFHSRGSLVKFHQTSIKPLSHGQAVTAPLLWEPTKFHQTLCRGLDRMVISANSISLPRKRSPGIVLV